LPVVGTTNEQSVHIVGGDAAEPETNHNYEFAKGPGMVEDKSAHVQRF
jgi:hypothetical protein